MMKILLLLSLLALTFNAKAETCFNATEIVEKAASPFASAAELEKALMTAAEKNGWIADQESANGAAYYIIGKYGTISDDKVKVCVTLDGNQDLSYQVFAEKVGNESAGFMPLVGKKQ